MRTYRILVRILWYTFRIPYIHKRWDYEVLSTLNQCYNIHILRSRMLQEYLVLYILKLKRRLNFILALLKEIYDRKFQLMCNIQIYQYNPDSFWSVYLLAHRFSILKKLNLFTKICRPKNMLCIALIKRTVYIKQNLMYNDE